MGKEISLYSADEVNSEVPLKSLSFLKKWINAFKSSEWNIRYGEWWMLQWQFAGWFSLGIHIDPFTRVVAGGPFAGKRYGPYIDIHLGCFIFSFGVRPYLTGELINQSGIARGGISVISDKPLKIGKIEIGFRIFVEIILIILLLLSIYRTFMITSVSNRLP